MTYFNEYELKILDRLQSCCSENEAKEERVKCVKLVKTEGTHSGQCADCFCNVMNRRLTEMCGDVIQRVDPDCKKKSF